MFNPLKHEICFANLLRVTHSTWIGHTPFAMFLVDILRPEILVELGTYYGTSYCAFCQAVDSLKINTKCYAIDTWKGDSQSGFYGNEILEDLKNYHDRLYGKFSRLIQSTFDESLIHFEEKSIDILHIDGFHTYNEVKKDFTKWLPKVSRKGVILFHDINVKERDFGVWKFWKEIKDKYNNFEFIHSHGLGVLAVGEECPQGFIDFLNFAEQNTPQIQDFFYQLGMRFETALENQNLRKTVETYNSVITKYQNQEQELKQLETNQALIKQLERELQNKSEQLLIKEQELDNLLLKQQTLNLKEQKLIDEENRIKIEEQKLLDEENRIKTEEQNLKLHFAEIEKENFRLEEERNAVNNLSKIIIKENQHSFTKKIELQKLISKFNKKNISSQDLIKLLDNKLLQINEDTIETELKFVIGVVTYNNSEDQISQLLNSIKIAIDNTKDLQIKFEIFVIDNGEETFWNDSDLNIAKFNSLGNIGFGKAMNHLMASAFEDIRTQWFLCLNPDGMLHFNSLKELIETYRLNPNSLIEARQFPAEHPKEYDPQTLDTPWVSGACLLIPQNIYEELNGFDSNFFMYMEDIDLSWRALSAGFSIKIAPKALFGHSVLDREHSSVTEKYFFLSGRYLAYKWDNQEFLDWSEKELVSRGHYSSIDDLPNLPTLQEENCLDKNIANFTQYFHFAEVRW